MSFLIVGVVATALQYFVLTFLVEVFSYTAPLASSIGFALSALVNYAMNYKYTFASSEPHHLASFKFALVIVVGLGFNYFIMKFLVTNVDMHYLVAQVMATAVVLLWNFWLNKRWSFKA